MSLHKLSMSVAAATGLVFSCAAHSDAWLSDGFDWSLPGYASRSDTGAMLDINGAIGNEDTEVPGTVLRILWRESEPVKGEFNFDRLDNYLERLNGNPLLLRLEVNSKCHAPDWVSIPYSSTQNFQFWRAEYIDQLDGFINALADRYKDEPSLVGVYLGISDGEYYQSTGNGSTQSECPVGTSYDDFMDDYTEYYPLIDGSGRDGWGEFWWTDAEEIIYEADGLNEDNFESSVIKIIDMYVDAFGASQAGKLVFMSYDDHGSTGYVKKLQTIHEYALNKGLGNRGGQIEAWMRNTDNVYGVDLKSGSNTDGSCSARFSESFADAIQGRYWGEENEFYGDLGYVIDPAANPEGSVGPLHNQAYRFYVSSMRALQLRRNYVSINSPGHRYLRSINEQFEYEYTNSGVYDETLLTNYRSGDFINYLSKTLGRSRSDTPDAFLVLGERTLNTYSGLYPTEYRQGNTQEGCLLNANSRGYATISDFGRWLSVVSQTEADQSMRKDMPQSENYWGQILSASRDGENYELYARKSNAMYLDINDRLIQERCSGSCKLEVKVVFKDDRVMGLQVVPANGTQSEILTTLGGGMTRTASFELDDFSDGGALPDFHIKTIDGTSVSVLMMRVNFLHQGITLEAPDSPAVLSPRAGQSTRGSVTFVWQPVQGATEYKVSYYNGQNYNGGVFMSADDLNCASGTCSYTRYNFASGASQWWVMASNANGESAWSSTADFTVVPPQNPVSISPTHHANVEGPVTFRWWPVAGALEYKVSFSNSGHYDGGTFQNAESLNCGSGVCSYTVTSLNAGDSMWWVLAKSSAGESGWSDTGHFSVTQ